MNNLFPVLLIFIDMCASIVYLCYGDLKHSVYWLSAAVLTICVTF